jgi:hypothetical protein
LAGRRSDHEKPSILSDIVTVGIGGVGAPSRRLLWSFGFGCLRRRFHGRGVLVAVFIFSDGIVPTARCDAMLDLATSAASRMNRTAKVFLLAATVLSAGCAAPDVKYSDLHPAPTAILAGNTVTLHLGSDLTASACWTKAKAKVEGSTVCIVGYRTLRERSREFVVRLPAQAASERVSVVWMNPDGSRVAVPLTK